MRKRGLASWKTLTSRAGVVLALLATATLAAVAAYADIPQEHARAIQTLATYVTSQSDHADNWLRDRHFVVADEESWRAFPVVRKLETAYLAAQSVSPSDGGQRFLALLSSDLARRYEAVRTEKAVQPFLSSTPEDERPLFPTSSSIQASVSTEEIEPRARQAILTLAGYCEGNALGGLTGVLVDYFDIPPDAAYEILRSSGSSQEALTRAAGLVPPGRLSGRLRNLVAAVDHAYEAARLEGSLDHLRRTPGAGGEWQGPRPRPAPSAPSGGASAEAFDFPLTRSVSAQRQSESALPQSRSASEAQAIAARESRYREFLAREYPQSSGRSFGPMIATVEGFGGVVFGAAVVAAPTLGRPVTIEWMPSSDSPDLGRLVVTLRRTIGGRSSTVRRTYGPVRLDHVRAAKAIVFDGVPKGLSWKPDDGIGLVGISDRTEYFDCGADSITNRGSRWRVVLHPALDSLSIGLAALHVDILPILGQPILDSVSAHASQRDFKLAQSWLASTPDNWKFTDAPLALGEDGPLLVVRRNDIARDSVYAFSSFMSVTPFLSSKSEMAKFRSTFPRLLPTLASVMPDFDQLNSFASELAIARWARSQGARFVGEIGGPTFASVPSAIVLTDDGRVQQCPDYSGPEARMELRHKVLRRMRELEAEFPEQARVVLDERTDFFGDTSDTGRRRAWESLLHGAKGGEGANPHFASDLGRVLAQIDPAVPEKELKRYVELDSLGSAEDTLAARVDACEDKAHELAPDGLPTGAPRAAHQELAQCEKRRDGQLDRYFTESDGDATGDSLTRADIDCHRVLARYSASTRFKHAVEEWDKAFGQLAEVRGKRNACSEEVAQATERRFPRLGYWKELESALRRQSDWE